jgi:hypothetical protein
VIDIGRQDGDPVLARVADQLGGRVEAHGLAIDQRGGERGRVVVFQIGRGVDQQGETGGVRLGESVFAEPADLLKDALSEFFGQAALAHAVQQFLAKRFDVAVLAPGCHRPAQLIRFARRESRGHHGQLHHLFLKNGNAQRFLQHAADLVVGVRHRLLAGPPPQIRMDHLALDRTRPDDGDLDHQIVVAAGPQPRQHGHLRSAFDLEDTDRIRAADHIVDGPIARRDVGQGQLLPAGLAWTS